MTAQQERRRASRIDFEAEVLIVDLVHRRHWSAQMVDISTRGVMVERPEGWPGDIGSEHPLALLIHLGNSEDGPEIEMHANAQRQTDQHIGFICTDISLEGISHLRRMIELNLGGEQAWDRELHAMLTEPVHLPKDA